MLAVNSKSKTTFLAALIAFGFAAAGAQGQQSDVFRQFCESQPEGDTREHDATGVVDLACYDCDQGDECGGCPDGCGSPDCFGCDCGCDCGDDCGCGCGCGCGAVTCGAACQPDDVLLWVGVEPLLWWTKGMRTPALATTGSEAGEGILGDPDTVVLFGDTRLLDDLSFGGRFRLGTWLNDERRESFEVSYLLLEENSETFFGSGANYTVLSRPFADVVLNTPNALNTVLPGEFDGQLFIDAETEFEALDAVYSISISKTRDYQLDFLMGYRYMELTDSVLIDNSFEFLSGGAAGATSDLFDRFDTQNTFHGGLFGLRLRNWTRGRWSCETSAIVGLGNVNKWTRIDGETINTDVSGGATTSAGGLLALPTNIGEHEDNHFSANYEIGVRLRRRIGCNSAISMGYTYLGWKSVYRAGEQIDLNVNSTQLSGGALVGEAVPAFLDVSSNYWAQGLNFSFETSF